MNLRHAMVIKLITLIMGGRGADLQGKMINAAESCQVWLKFTHAHGYYGLNLPVNCACA